MADTSDTVDSRRGSEWRRWDPHLHAPGTLLADHFARTRQGEPEWKGFLERVEGTSPGVRALGVTDYFCIRTYKRARTFKAEGRMPNVALLFPNVELRLDLKTDKVRPVNLHLLFSPDDPDHVSEIERVLGRLSCHFQHRPWQCTEQDLMKIGRLLDSKQANDDAALAAGANQFKVTLDQIRELFREDDWVRRNCLVAVAGSRNDGTSGLQGDDSYLLMRREVESFAHIIFAATPSQRDFWLGRKVGHDRATIERTYGSLKPCLHGSDAHGEEKVGVPDLDRFCWLKGDPTFETLRQAVLEPDERVWIGPTPPPHYLPQIAVSEARCRNAPWLTQQEFDLNPGLVAVIGARGSGKTAFVEIIAKGGRAPGTGVGESSFLSRARRPIDLLGDAAIEISWRDGSSVVSPLSLPGVPADSSEPGDVCYLSQQFVDRLCSSAGLAQELRAEMERVIFEATDPLDRLEASSLRELIDVLLEPVRHRRDELRADIRSRTQEIVTEEELHAKLPQLAQERKDLSKKLEQAQKDLAALLPKGTEDRAKRLAVLEQAHAGVQTRIEGLKRRRQALEELQADVEQIRSTTELRRLSELRRRHQATELSDDKWKAFAMVFAGNVDDVIAAERALVDAEIAVASSGTPGAPIDVKVAPEATWPLTVLRAQRDRVKKEVGIDVDSMKKYEALRKSIEQMEASSRRLSADVERATGADSRRRSAIDARRAAYADVFSTFAEEEATLERLYEPLSSELRQASGALGRLSFFVHRRVDIDAWVDVGERELLDLRLESRVRGHGALKKVAEEWLLPALAAGAARDVAESMDAFRKEYATDLKASMPRATKLDDRGRWLQAMAEWLYSTEHVYVEYGIRYDGTAVEQLSPGTRGIVLLLLYLAIDRQDRRPLIVDQPEENLDPKSVFEELVPHFREARRRRQVIIVTHNANLVVNTDADQVIVASSVAAPGQGLPSITYDSGGLENPRIRKAVCEILEGGERAFLERERRYRLLDPATGRTQSGAGGAGSGHET